MCLRKGDGSGYGPTKGFRLIATTLDPKTLQLMLPGTWRPPCRWRRPTLHRFMSSTRCGVGLNTTLNQRSMKSVPPRPSSFVDRLGHHGSTWSSGCARDVLQGSAADELSILELLDGGEVLIDECSVGQGPGMLGGLELGRIRRQEQQMQMLRHRSRRYRAPAGAIEHQHDLFAWAAPTWRANAANSTSKSGILTSWPGGRRCARRRDGQSRRDSARRSGAGPWRRDAAQSGPDAAQDRLESDTMFVGGPEFDPRLRVRGCDRLDERSELFLRRLLFSIGQGMCGRGACRLCLSVAGIPAALQATGRPSFADIQSATAAASACPAEPVRPAPAATPPAALPRACAAPARRWCAADGPCRRPLPL